MLVALGVLCLAYLISLAVRIDLDGQRDERQPADVIVVLGNAQANGRPLPILQGRIDHALDLYRKGLAPYLLFTGGNQPGDRFTEADAGRMYAIEHGVPESAILMESHGRTTWQELQAATGILRAMRLHRVILVSDDFHAFRLHRMAADLGMQACVSPVPPTPGRRRTTHTYAIFREVAAYFVYRSVGM